MNQKNGRMFPDPQDKAAKILEMGSEMGDETVANKNQRGFDQIVVDNSHRYRTNEALRAVRRRLGGVIATYDGEIAETFDRHRDDWLELRLGEYVFSLNYLIY